MPGLIAAILAIGMGQMGGWRSLEQFGYNALFQARDGVGISDPGWDSRIVVIAIDELSLQQYGRFPLPRRYYTELFRVLEFSQPAVIGFDILFTEPTAEDGALAAAMTAHPVVLAVAGDNQAQQINLVPGLETVSWQGHVLKQVDADGISRQFSLSIFADSHLYSIPKYSNRSHSSGCLKCDRR
ncbi:MAG: CHASE2 domain-containing protein [Cyanothece sp. SIO1E1]|nr:CHASE2 domain-containing protein [Cyanothece sp. SIO1E1]